LPIHTSWKLYDLSARLKAALAVSPVETQPGGPFAFKSLIENWFKLQNNYSFFTAEWLWVIIQAGERFRVAAEAESALPHSPPLCRSYFNNFCRRIC